MDEQTKELIAIGASVSGHCQPCLATHVMKARELGAGEGDIQTAIEIGFMVEKGALIAQRSYVSALFSRSRTPSNVCCTPGDSKCCG